MNIEVTAPKVDRQASFDIAEKLATDLDGYVELYGEDALTNLITRMVITDLRNGARTKMELTGDKLQDDDVITAWIAGWKPGNRKAAKSKTEKTMDAFDGLSPEEQIATLQRMQARLEELKTEEA